MKRKTILVIGLIILFLVLCLGLYLAKTSTSNISKAPKDVVYSIGGESVIFTNGASEITFPDFPSKIITQYFGNDVVGDFDGDGTMDKAFIVTQNSGGSGTFFYVTALLNTKNGGVGVEGILLGDRISPQSMNLDNDNTIVVNYADRGLDESFATTPSIAKTIKLYIDKKTLKFVNIKPLI